MDINKRVCEHIYVHTYMYVYIHMLKYIEIFFFYWGVLFNEIFSYLKKKLQPNFERYISDSLGVCFIYEISQSSLIQFSNVSKRHMNVWGWDPSLKNSHAHTQFYSAYNLNITVNTFAYHTHSWEMYLD